MTDAETYEACLAWVRAVMRWMGGDDTDKACEEAAKRWARIVARCGEVA